MIERYLEKHILEDLDEKMVFVSGPRQVGKTTLTKQIGNKYFKDNFEYLNWDNREDRRIILNSEFKAGKNLFIFDEIHKYKNWKNYLKGEYDKNKERFKILVTGSARLNIFRKGGDSLLGRYRSFRLHPFSLGELSGQKERSGVSKELIFSDKGKPTQEFFSILFKFGGFPEIVVKQDEKVLRRWHSERTERLIKEDIRDIENIKDLSALQILAEILPSKVGSLFSLNSLKEDLQVTHKTISSWVDIMEKFYYHFRIYPFQSTLIKSLRKEPKIYLWDWSEVNDENARFENIIASHLLKYCDFLNDWEGYKAQLFYLRDKEQREIDFLICVDNKPWFCVEAKSKTREIPTSLKYFGEKLKIPYKYMVLKEENIDFFKENVRFISASKFLTAFV